jgi:hypothetical protein
VTPRSRSEAWSATCRWAESRRKLLGLDPPARKQVEFVDTSSWERDLEALLGEAQAEERARAWRESQGRR